MIEQAARAALHDPRVHRIGLPAAVGVLAALVLQSGAMANPVLRIGLDLGTVLLIVGLLSTAIWAATARWASRADDARHRAVAEAQARATLDERARARADHARFRNRLRHELQTPLTTIHAVLRECAAASPGRSVDAAVASCARLITMVQHIQRLDRLEQGAIEQEPLQLAEVLRDAVAAAREHHAAPPEDVRLDLPVTQPLPPVIGDVVLLHQAVFSLVDNALKYGGDGAIVEVRAMADQDFVRVTVSNAGPGIAPGDQPHVFEELYRSNEVRGVPGSGLGLTLVKVVAERHGGSVRLESEPGKFTTFVLRIPVANISAFRHTGDAAEIAPSDTDPIDSPRRLR